MIIKIDHIAVSSRDFNRHINILKSLGYKPQFVEKGIENLKIKRGLMQDFSEYHDLALLESKGNIPIELLDHRHVGSNNSYIIPVFENIPESLIEKSGVIRLGEIALENARIKGFDASIYFNRSISNQGFRFNKLIVKAANIKKSIIFWGRFGFKVVEEGGDFAKLELKSLLDQSTYQVFLQESDYKDDKPCLDDRGFNCIAFVSNSAKNEKDFLNKKGIETTEIEEINLNHKRLDIFFAIGPSGELVEIIGVKR